jgi:hypothetical protein
VRLPDWAYARLERVYLDQRSAHRKESAAQADQDNQALQAWADRMRDAHDMGTCGGAAAGCLYVPCVPLVRLLTLRSQDGKVGS